MWVDISDDDLNALLDAADSFKDAARKRSWEGNPQSVFQVDTHLLPLIAYALEYFVHDRSKGSTDDMRLHALNARMYDLEDNA